MLMRVPLKNRLIYDLGEGHSCHSGKDSRLLGADVAGLLEDCFLCLAQAQHADLVSLALSVLVHNSILEYAHFRWAKINFAASAANLGSLALLGSLLRSGTSLEARKVSRLCLQGAISYSLDVLLSQIRRVVVPHRHCGLASPKSPGNSSLRTKIVNCFTSLHATPLVTVHNIELSVFMQVNIEKVNMFEL